MKVIEKTIDFIFKTIEILIAVLFGVMVVLVFMQVLARVLNASLTWSEEIVNYSMIWIAMLGGCVLMRSRGHMAIDNVINALKGPAKVIIEVISVSLQVVFLVLLIIGFFQFYPTAAVQSSPVLQLNMGLIYMIFPASGILMLLGLIDYWIVNKGSLKAYSEEDVLLKQVQEEATKAAVEQVTSKESEV